MYKQDQICENRYPENHCFLSIITKIRNPSDINIYINIYIEDCNVEFELPSMRVARDWVEDIPMLSYALLITSFCIIS